MANGQDPVEWLTPSSGELKFLWWFIQGSIMDADVRQNMLRAWGLCERHTLIWLRVEAALRHGYLHGPAVYYSDLMAHAEQAFTALGAFSAHWIAHRLQANKPCHLCAMGLGTAPQMGEEDEKLGQGLDAMPLMTFMAETEPSWRPHVCGRCARSPSLQRCREHLCEDIEQGHPLELARHREDIQTMARHISHYDASFQWELRGTDTLDDRAALIRAAGWSAGWRYMLAFYDGANQGEASC